MRGARREMGEYIPEPRTERMFRRTGYPVGCDVSADVRRRVFDRLTRAPYGEEGRHRRTR